ncbi:acyltransferase [Cellulomonas cellasea]|uniref:acyltransferase family protein n=1 Tax=Cellulomonas cellasea TaxID=43670 RepID=UPI0025A3363A|nr:acyltransferase [Cellulomonas cellasea]MDM8084698.1 acyltransferase [Cellulomonas cellasea]
MASDSVAVTREAGVAPRSANRTVADVGRPGSNALNFMRLVLAASVIVSHTAAIGGFQAEMPGWIGWVAEWAVNGFFVLSGFLIAGSRMRLPLGPFLWNRAVRIFPGYWMALIVVAIAVAPASALISGENYQLRSAMDYLLNNSMLLTNQWGIEGTLLTVPHPGAWNGSLWTLYYEFWAYLLAGVLLSGALIRRHAGWVSVGLLVIVTVSQVAALGAVDSMGASWLSALRLGAFFLAGMVMHFFGHRARLSWLAAVGCLVVLVIMLEFGQVNVLGHLPFAYILLWLGGRLPTRIGSVNDLSYGTYVYAFPIQQLLALFGGVALGPYLFALVAFALTLPLAWASWRFIESPAMRYRMSSGNRHGGDGGHPAVAAHDSGVTRSVPRHDSPGPLTTV